MINMMTPPFPPKMGKDETTIIYWIEATCLRRFKREFLSRMSSHMLNASVISMVLSTMGSFHYKHTRNHDLLYLKKDRQV